MSYCFTQLQYDLNLKLFCCDDFCYGCTTELYYSNVVDIIDGTLTMVSFNKVMKIPLFMIIRISPKYVMFILVMEKECCNKLLCVCVCVSVRFHFPFP